MRSSRFKNKEPNDLTPSPFFEKERTSNFFEKSSKPFFKPAIQPKLKTDQPGDALEQEADMMAGKVTGTSGRLIVDDTAEASAMQMRKSEFIAALKQAAHSDAPGLLSAASSTAGLSGNIEATFARYQGNTPAQLEQLIREQLPAANQAASAGELIQLIKATVIAGIKSKVPGGGAMADAIGGAAQTVSNAVKGAGSAVSDAVSGASNVLFKANSGGAHNTQSPSAVMQNLGSGQALDSRSQSKMESAFGTSFSDVEMHNDANAAQLSGNMNARAFTVGNHVAFGNGQYQPGTLVGDALMAHELAHVVQQRGVTRVDDKGAGYQSLEQDADEAALSAIMGRNGRPESGTVETRKPKGRSGLRIQRCIFGCSSKESEKKDTPAPSDAKAPADAGPPPHPATPLTRPGKLGISLEGKERKKWRYTYDTKVEAQNQVDRVRAKYLKADDPEKEGKKWVFYYYPVSEAEIKEMQVAKQKELGDKYDVKAKEDKTMQSWYLEITLKCPDAIPAKAGFEIWDSCFTAEKDAKGLTKKFADSKLQAEVFQVDESLYGVYFKPYKTEAEAKAAGEVEAKKRPGHAEGMYGVTATYNKDLKSFLYNTTTSCPPGYTDAGEFELTIFVLPKEDDFDEKPTVKDPCGLKGSFREKFLYPAGVKRQGSGITSSGKRIQYDTAKSTKDKPCFYRVENPLTASGTIATEGRTVAVDKKEITLGTDLLVEDVGPRVAEDTGGGIIGKEMDIYFGTSLTVDGASAHPLSRKYKKVCKKDKAKKDKP